MNYYQIRRSLITKILIQKSHDIIIISRYARNGIFDKKKKESRIQNQKPWKRSDIKNNRGKLDSERHLKSENIKGTRVHSPIQG